MNPTLSYYLPIYKKMRDTMKSEEHMKNVALSQSSSTVNAGCDQSGKLTATSKFSQYLRPSDGMRRSDHGYQRFCDYIFRAKYYPYPLETKDQALGMIQNEPPVIELPSSLEFMRGNSTSNYESLEKVMSIVNSEQMVVSRAGLLLSPVNGISNEPFNIWLYKAEAIQDWNEIIDGSGEKDIDWLVLLTKEMKDDKPVYQVLYIEKDGFYATYKTTNEESEYGVYADDEMIADSWVQPNVRESKLDRIPFVVINTQRLGYDFEKPYLEPLSDASIKLFQASARYEDAVEWGGKSTMFLSGVDEKAQYVAGNGAVIKTNNADAKGAYLTSGIEGTEPCFKDVESKEKHCISLGVDLVNQGVESGVALATRANIKTASLKTLAKTCAEGVERLLKIGAVWIGANPDEVSITANTSFADPVYTADDLLKMSMLVRNGDMEAEAFFNILKKMELTVADVIGDADLQKEIEDQSGTSL